MLASVLVFEHVCVLSWSIVVLRYLPEPLPDCNVECIASVKERCCGTDVKVAMNKIVRQHKPIARFELEDFMGDI